MFFFHQSFTNFGHEVVPMAFYENAHRLRDGAILVFTRPGRKKTTYQARLKIQGLVAYFTRSLKTAELNAALAEAEDLYYELRAA